MPRHNETKESGCDDCKDHERDDLLHDANPYRRRVGPLKRGMRTPHIQHPVDRRREARKPRYNNRKEITTPKLQQPAGGLEATTRVMEQPAEVEREEVTGVNRRNWTLAVNEEKCRSERQFVITVTGSLPRLHKIELPAQPLVQCPQREGTTGNLVSCLQSFIAFGRWPV